MVILVESNISQLMRPVSVLVLSVEDIRESMRSINYSLDGTEVYTDVRSASKSSGRLTTIRIRRQAIQMLTNRSLRPKVCRSHYFDTEILIHLSNHFDRMIELEMRFLIHTTVNALQ